MLVVVSNTKYGREKKTADWVMWRTLSCWLGWLWSVWYFDHRVRVFTKWGHFLNPRKRHVLRWDWTTWWALPTPRMIVTVGSGRVGSGVVSCPNHTKLSIRFQLWNCWGLCLGKDVGSPLFTLLQPEMPMDGARSGRCAQSLNQLAIATRPVCHFRVLGSELRCKSCRR